MGAPFEDEDSDSTELAEVLPDVAFALTSCARQRSRDDENDCENGRGVKKPLTKTYEKVNPTPAVSRMTDRVTDAPSRISARQHSYLDQRKSMSTAFFLTVKDE
jgi:hypothetical protein